MLPPYTLNHKTYFEFEYPTCIPNIAPFNLEETTKEDVFERLKEILLVLNSLSSGGKIKDQVKTLTLGKRYHFLI